MKTVSPSDVASSFLDRIRRTGSPHPGEVQRTLDLSRLDAEDLRILRAASVIGHSASGSAAITSDGDGLRQALDSFDVSVLARLIDDTEEALLESLQRARDIGVPIIDTGNGKFDLPRELGEALRATILPSLRVRWEARLTEIRGRSRAVPGEARPPTTTSTGPAIDRSLDAAEIRARLEALAWSVQAGDAQPASEELAAILDASARLAPGPLRAALFARADLERARIGWLGVGLEPSFTLASALEMALVARAEIGRHAAPAEQAEAAAVIAGIAYDLGDGASLESAREVIRSTLEGFPRGGAPVEIVMLLNDLAAIELRMGHVGEATELATRSRESLLEALATQPTQALRVDLAFTEHLLARLPLHRRGGADLATLPAAIAHARAAELFYKEAGLLRDRGRVLDTIARLELAGGESVTARRIFVGALNLADEAFDLTGLARSTAGLASILAAEGETEEALRLLSVSIELNQQKCSPIGVAFDERLLCEVERDLGPVATLPRSLTDELARTRTRLVEAIEATTTASSPGPGVAPAPAPT